MIRQGHLYAYAGYTVIAMETRESGRVSCRQVFQEPYHHLGTVELLLEAGHLAPLPMKYHGNAIPGEKP